MSKEMVIVNQEIYEYLLRQQGLDAKKNGFVSLNTKKGTPIIWLPIGDEIWMVDLIHQIALDSFPASGKYPLGVSVKQVIDLL
jgi:hypothetical protein